MKYIIFLIPVLAFAFFLVYSPIPKNNVRYKSNEDLNEKVFIVSPLLVDCEKGKCFQVKETRGEEYSVFNNEIIGFDHTRGLEYEIRVKQDKDDNYTLSSVLLINNPNESRLAQSQDYPIVKVNEIGELKTEILTEGIGEEVVESNDTVVANYTGWIASTGEIFDSSFNSGSDRGIEFSLSMVIQGWTQGLTGMKIGEVRRIYVPSELGYGELETEQIPANSDLIFNVELMSIK